MDRIRELLRARPVLAGVVALIIVGLGAASTLVFVSGPTATPTPAPTSSPSPSPTPTPSPTPSPSPTASPSPVAALCPWNGLPMAAGEELSPVALAVQIENNPVARPVANLGLADMVVEATVEGDVTRFTAIYQCNRTQGLTGPVRSARYYTIDVWQDLHVLPFFFGAGWEELRRYDVAGMPYVNGLFGAWPGGWFTRHGSKAAPHNLYADVEAARDSLGSNAALDAQADRVGASRPQFNFDPAVSAPEGGRAISSVELRTNSYWRIGWTWDATSGSWLRTDGGTPNVDEVTGEQLSARTVIVEKVVETVDNAHHDPGGSPRREHQMTGSGTGILYLDGKAYDVKWSRPTVSDGTTWTYAASGAEVVLPPGVVWWEIIPTYATVAER